MSPAQVVVVLAVLVVIALWLWRRPDASIRADPDLPLSFGYKCTWLAVRASSADEVVEALRQCGQIRKARPCNWKCGFEQALRPIAGRKLFVSPAVRGWVFVLNYRLGGDVELDRVAALGARLGCSVYGFGSHRGVSAALWVVAEAGAVTRAWCTSDGETVYDRGSVTPEEAALDIAFAPDPDLATEDDEHWARSSNETTVLALAAAWTLDPTNLEAHPEPGVGSLAW